MAIGGMCIACWMINATDTNSEYVIIITFPLQQWLHGSASMLRYMYTAWLTVFLRTFHKWHSSFCTRTTEMSKVHRFNIASRRGNTMYKRWTKRYALTASITVLQTTDVYTGPILGGGAAVHQYPPNLDNKIHFVEMMIPNALSDLPFS